MSVKKPPIHWDWVETHWQRGNVSNVQLAKNHEEEFGRKIDEKSIRLHASQYGWQRDISEAIRRETRSKLAKGELRETPSPLDSDLSDLSDSESRAMVEAEELAVIDRASDALVSIEKSQRLYLARSGVLAERMELYALSMLTVDSDGCPNLVYEPGELKDIIAAAGQSVYTRMRIINTERKVFGMDSAAAIASQNEDGEGGVTQVHVYIPDNGRSGPRN